METKEKKFYFFFTKDRNVKFFLNNGFTMAQSSNRYLQEYVNDTTMEEFESPLFHTFANHYYHDEVLTSDYGKAHKVEDYIKVGNFFRIPYYVQDFMNPVLSKKEDLIYFFENPDKMRRGVSAKIKVGRFIKKIYPFLNDKQVEEMVKIFREEFTVGPCEVVVGDKPEDFKFAYLMNNYREVHRDTSNFKSLWNSCMRYDFSMNYHPAEMYGSGDFEIHYLKGEDGKVLGRSVVHKESKTYADIYAIQDGYGQLLMKHFHDNGYVGFYEDEENRNWYGAKLLKNQYGDDSYCVAYMDGYSLVDDEGDYLVISKHGDHELNKTSGFIFLQDKCSCYECGSTIYGDDEYYIDGETYCECCVTFCDYTQEYVVGETIEVYTRMFASETWGIDHIHNAIYLEDLRKYIHPESDYFVWGEVDGEYYSDDWLSENGYIFNDDGEWVQQEENEDE